MPLINGASAASFKANYEELLRSGRPAKQAFAIAASIARDNIGKVNMNRRQQIRKGQFFG